MKGNKAKLLFVDQAIGLGGAQHSLLMLLRHLEPCRWQIHLACAPGSLADVSEAAGIRVHRIAFPRLRRSPTAVIDLTRQSLRIARLAKNIHASCIIANTTRTSFYAGLSSCVASLPFLWYRRDFWLGETHPRVPLADSLGKALLCITATRIIVNSYATARHLPCSKKISVIHNGIELDHFRPEPCLKQFHLKHASSDRNPVIGTVGRLLPWKGQARFLRVLARVTDVMPKVQGIVVGGTPFGGDNAYFKKLQLLTEELGLKDNITFTGQLEDPRPAVAAMDIFVHPGDPEPFGLVNIEAMAMQKPVVAFAHGALPEIVVDGKTGLLVSPEDEAAMASALVYLLGNPDKCREMGLQGRQRVQQEFSIEKTAAEFSCLVADLLK